MSDFFLAAAIIGGVNIPEALLQSIVRFSSDFLVMLRSKDKWDSFKFREILVGLRKLSLLQITKTQNHEFRFTIHPVICEWIKLRSKEYMPNIVAGFVALAVCEQIILITSATADKGQELLPFVDACVDNHDQLPEINDLRENFKLCYPTAYRIRATSVRSCPFDCINAGAANLGSS